MKLRKHLCANFNDYNMRISSGFKQLALLLLTLLNLFLLLKLLAWHGWLVWLISQPVRPITCGHVKTIVVCLSKKLYTLLCTDKFQEWGKCFLLSVYL